MKTLHYLPISLSPPSLAPLLSPATLLSILFYLLKGLSLARVNGWAVCIVLCRPGNLFNQLSPHKPTPRRTQLSRTLLLYNFKCTSPLVNTNAKVPDSNYAAAAKAGSAKVDELLINCIETSSVNAELYWFSTGEFTEMGIFYERFYITPN